VLWLEGLGQLREWQWEVFHFRGHKDVPIVTLQFRHKGIRYRSRVGSVTEFTRDPTGLQRGLVTGVANLATSARIVWAREFPRSLWRQLEFTRMFQENLKEDRR
jgi:hypothetical protein